MQILRYLGANDVADPGTKSMIFYMAEALSRVGQALYLVFSPLIGILGAFVSGGNTVFSTLFTNLQYQSACNPGLAPVFFVALQTIGGSIGNMICVNNTVAVCATLGTFGREGRIIRANLLLMIRYAVVVINVFAIVIGVLGIVPGC